MGVSRIKPFNPNTLGHYLRDRRKEEGVSIRELSEEIGLSRSQISAIELGEVQAPCIHTLDKFAQFFGEYALTLLGMVDNHTVKSLAYLHFYEENHYVSKK